jgi:exopolysaccharide biosynthesis polyprenyl glycosylphosphotransferase
VFLPVVADGTRLYDGSPTVGVKRGLVIADRGEMPSGARGTSEAISLDSGLAGATTLDAPTWRRALQRDATYRRLLAVADIVSLGLALWIGVGAADGDGLTPLGLLAFPALVLIGKVLGLYDRDPHLLNKTTLEEIPTIFHLTVLTTLGLWVAGGVVVDGRVTAGGALVTWAVLFVAIVATRALARRVALATATRERCVVLGDGESARELARKLDSNPATELVGQLDAQTDGIRAYLLANEVDRVVLAPSASDRVELLPLVGEVSGLGAKLSVLPSPARALGSAFELDRLDEVTLLGIRGVRLTRSSRLLKRVMDLAISLAALVILAPVFALIALAIRLDSPGPVLYRQTRIGRDAKSFRMLKFRTMCGGDAHQQRDDLRHLNEAVGGLFKIENDPRVTRVGRGLRRFSLDELPQLVNVLRGEMSLVGPRPLVAEEDQLIKGWRRQRLALTPGMTGYWQVLGSARIPLEEMVELDCLYVQNWSAWSDIKLLFRTVSFVCGRRGM